MSKKLKENPKEKIIKEVFQSEEFESLLEKEIYSKSYYEFYKKAYSIIRYGEHYSDNWHIQYLCDRLQKEFEIGRASCRERV